MGTLTDKLHLRAHERAHTLRRRASAWASSPRWRSSPSCGILLCRGTLLSMAMVLLALPALLMIFDPLTARLTLKAGFLKKTDKEVETK